MLEIGTAGSSGAGEGVTPVLLDGSVVETGTTVDVETASRWKNAHRYPSGGRTVAESGTSGGWSPRPTPTTDGPLRLDHSVVLLWLELVLTRRNTAAMTAAVGAAVIGGSS